MKKKIPQTKIVSVETVEEYLARGGECVTAPAQPPPEEKQIVRPMSNGLPTIMSLEDGAFFFSENRKKQKKEVTNNDFINKLNSSELPNSVIEALKSAIGGEKNE